MVFAKPPSSDKKVKYFPKFSGGGLGGFIDHITGRNNVLQKTIDLKWTSFHNFQNLIIHQCPS